MVHSRFYRCWPLFVLVAGLAFEPGAAGGKELGGSPTTAVLSLANGDFVEGALLDSDRRDILRWQARQFAAALDFDLGAIAGVHFPPPRERIEPQGEYCLELRGGDLLFGALLSLGAKELEVDCPRFGRLHLQRSRIERISRWRNGKELVYIGPNGLSGWEKPKPADSWRTEANALVADQARAEIVGDLGIPSQACIELELSWIGAAEFGVALGLHGQDDSRAFRIEISDGKLLGLWMNDSEADVAVLQPAVPDAGRCHLRVYLDQVRQRAVVFSSDGSQLADLSVSGATSKPGSAVRLSSRRGGLRLEQLIVRKYNEAPPQQAAGGRPHLYRDDGSIVYGEVEAFDAKKNRFVIAEKDGEKTRKIRIDAGRVDSIVWSRPNPAPSGDVHLCLHDGVRVAGRLREVKGNRLWLDCPGVAEPLGVKLTDLLAVSIPNRGEPVTDTGHRQGRLEMEGVRLHGYAVDGADLSARGCLGWHPFGGATASPLLASASGAIVYYDPPPPRPVSPTYAQPVRVGAQPRAVAGAGWLDVLAGGPPRVSVYPLVSRGSANLYLCTGDKIPCKVKRIDQRGVWFESSKYEATFVPHDRIKAVELENASHDTKVNPTKRDRLLTLPRMRRDNPPKQLIRSVDGDYLRANVVSLDENTLTVEVRLEERHLPRSNIARIIWLHEGDSERENKSATPMRVQSLDHEGNRVTVLFEKLTEATLIGTSDAMGRCRIDLKDVDELFFGTMSELTAKELPYQRWKLRAAQDPKFAASGDSEGTESALVGTMAPEFTLERLDGTTFRLSEQRGKVVVLDFWASWCGACMQVLPEIDRLVAQQKSKDVALVAVNLQETRKTIRAALDRLNVKPMVVLDENGAVAAKYAASAIPQTVIVDRSGKVAHVFVGGGPQYVEQVRDSLKKALTEGNGHVPPN